MTTRHAFLSDPTDQLAWLALADWLEENGDPGTAIVRTLNLRMVHIPASAILTQSFCMGIYPVTQTQWQAVMGSNPSHFNGDDRPVECVSWYDCLEFCDKLQQLTGVPFRLPTEAEWEHACRASTTTDYYSGDGENVLKKVGWYLHNSGNQTHPVGRLEPNSWGLFDMHGNVWEWCQDTYSADMSRMIRGGSWFNISRLCRSVDRSRDEPNNRSQYVGFRLAVENSDVW